MWRRCPRPLKTRHASTCRPAVGVASAGCCTQFPSGGKPDKAGRHKQCWQAYGIAGSVTPDASSHVATCLIEDLVSGCFRTPRSHTPPDELSPFFKLAVTVLCPMLLWGEATGRLSTSRIGRQRERRRSPPGGTRVESHTGHDPARGSASYLGSLLCV